MSYVYAIGFVLVLAILARWIWKEGVREGWEQGRDDASYVLFRLGESEQRNSWICCSGIVKEMQPDSLPLVERCKDAQAAAERNTISSDWDVLAFIAEANLRHKKALEIMNGPFVANEFEVGPRKYIQ